MKIFESVTRLFKKDPSKVFKEEYYQKFLAEYKKVAAKECAHLVPLPDEEPLATDSKFGGMPYIPVGEEWPTYPKSGDLVPFIGQIKLSDVHLPEFPETGMLEIFGTMEDRLILKIMPEGMSYREDLPSDLRDYDPDYSDNNPYFYNARPLKVAVEPWVDYLINDCYFDETYEKFVTEAGKKAFGIDFENVDAVEKYIGSDPKVFEQCMELRLFQDVGKVTQGFCLGGYPHYGYFIDEEDKDYEYCMFAVNEMSLDSPFGLTRLVEDLDECPFLIMVSKEKLKQGDLSDYRFISDAT